MEFEGLTSEETARLLPDVPIMVSYRGSHSHGTYMPPKDPNGADDIDIMTVYIKPQLSAYFGVDGQNWTGKDVKINQWDGVCYELQHFAKLAMTCNPNVISALWLDKQFYLKLDWPFRRVLNQRHLFSSKIAHKSFGGYAYSQLKRMTAWNEAQTSLCGCSGMYHSSECKEKEEKGRGSSKLYATGFMGEKRKALVSKFGYDVKNAAHLIRLLRMGEEFLRTGEIQVYRPDREELMSIKRGEWSLEAVQKEAEGLYAKLDESLKSSKLPDTPNFAEINNLITEIMCDFFSIAA
jgi:predicted nucleotidyltransferase